jgi:hypothetical protein
VKHARLILTAVLAFTGTASYADDASSLAAPIFQQNARDYRSEAQEVMQHIQTAFYLSDQGLYAHSITDRSPDFMWGNGVMFSALLGAARHEPKTYLPIVSRFFDSLDRYWDAKAKVPGYEPSPTDGDGHDKYYDDNAWMVLNFVEAYEMTHEAKFLQRARETLRFVLSGWDDARGGGIWWHEAHKDGSKNTCVNAPAAVACLQIAKYMPPDQAKEYRAMARKIVDWTSHTLEEDGVYNDRISVDSGQIRGAKLTYNTGLMIRAYLGLYRDAKNVEDLDHARRCAAAADCFVNKETNAFRDSPTFSHLLFEADLELYGAIHDEYLLRRAIHNADYEFDSWKKKPAHTLISNASIARTLWLMADLQANSH